MKRNLQKSVANGDSEDDIWEYKSLKREKRDSLKQSQNDKESQNRFSCLDSGRLKSKKTLQTKPKEKNVRQQNKQSKKDIKGTEVKSEPSNRHPQKNEITPYCQDILEGFCPQCQVPYSALSLKSPTWHVNECMEREMATEECPAGLACDNNLPNHYWKFSHWQLAQLRGSGTKILDDQKGQQNASHVKINLFDENQPGHSRNSSREHVHGDAAAKVQTNKVKVTRNDIESDEEKDLDDMLANAFDEKSVDSIGSISSPVSKSNAKNYDECSDLVITKETFGVPLDNSISFSPLSSPDENLTLRKSLSQGSLDNYIEIDGGIKRRKSSPSQGQMAFKTPPKSAPPSERKSSSKNSTNKRLKKTFDSDSDSPRLGSLTEKGNKSSGKKTKKDKTSDLMLESSSPKQPSMKSFFKSLNAKKILFEKSEENVRLSNDSNYVQMTSVSKMNRDIPLADSEKETGTNKTEFLIGENSDIQDTIDPPGTVESNCDTNIDFTTVKKEIPENVQQNCTVMENTEKSLKCVENSKNAFSILMKKTKSQSEPSQSQGCQGKVDATSVLMKAKQWGTNRATESYSRRAEDNRANLTIPEPEPEKKQWDGQRKCPFYKKMPDTGITVDAFSFGTIPDCSAYFLSHFHYDHYRGLTKKFKHPIYCSKVTANLVESRLKVERRYLHALPMDCPTVVEGVEVTLLEANHCPGSVLFLFKLKGGRNYLHTGDFRACTQMESYPALQRIHIHQLYLDTTYCDPSYTFPPQQEVIDFAVSLVHKKLKENQKTLIVCGSYTIGKERIFVAIANALNTKICVTREKKAVLDCLEDKKLLESITLRPNEAQVHVLQMTKLNLTSLTEHLATMKNHTEILAFEPTGWTHNNKITSLDQLRPKCSRNGIHIYGVPYSEHSSYLEMKRFTQYVKPDKILPTVNNGNARARSKMERLFQSWLQELKTSNRKQNPGGSKQGTLTSWTS